MRLTKVFKVIKELNHDFENNTELYIVKDLLNLSSLDSVYTKTRATKLKVLLVISKEFNDLLTLDSLKLKYEEL